MKSMIRKPVLISFLLAAAVMLSSCGKPQSTGVEKNDGSLGSKYPLKTEETLKYWRPINGNMSATASNAGELPYSKELSRLTGVKVEYIHPSIGQEVAQFNLLIASGDLPDIIEYYWTYFPGGPEKAIDDGHIIALNEAFEKYSPNLWKYLNEHEEINKLSKTDSGSYYCYPLVLNDRALQTTGGLIIRKDWLDELGLQIPETIDEWYVALKAFKEKKGATAPLTVGVDAAVVGAFTGAYNTKYGYYVEDGKVKYGPMEQNYREYFKTMNKWFNEGLLDNNFSTIDSKTISANMLNGTSGAAYGGLGGSLGKWIEAKKDSDPKYKLAGAPYPAVNKGGKSRFGQLELAVGDGAAISSKSKNVELAARFLDFSYSEEGAMLNNFGIEGESYKMVDGYPEYTDIIMNNQEGLSMAAALARYVRSGGSGPFIQDKRYLEQYAGKPEQRQAWESWMDTEAAYYNFPNLFVSEEERTEYAKLTNAIDTYTAEMYVKFISGAEPIEKFDAYVENLKKIGVEKQLAMLQSAYERYLAR